MTKLNAKMTDSVVAALLVDGETTVAWDDKELRILESRGIVTIMPITALSTNPDNPRDGDWKTAIADLADEIKTYGFDKSQPLTVLLNESDATKGMTLRGNRRLSAILKIQAETPDLFATLFPDGTVPVVTFAKLGATDIANLIVDHGKGRKRLELNSYELYLAVRVFVKSGTASQTDIGRKFGRSRSWAQKMVALTKLPIAVREAFKPVLLNKLDETKLRMQDILIVARDYAGKSTDAFNTAWSGFVDGTNADGQYAQSAAAGSAAGTDMLDYTDLRGRIESFDSPTFVRVVTAVTVSKNLAVTLDSAFKAMETELTELRAVKAALTESEMTKVTKRLAVPTV